MMIRALKVCSLIFIFCSVFSQTEAQDLTGIWRGYFITDGADQYKYEVQIEQSATKRLTGVTYSYLDTRFYGKATFTGNVNTASNNALIQEIKTVEVRMSGGSFACIMKCNVVYSKSGNEEFLEGTYTSMYEQSDSLLGLRRGGNCGGGKLFLRKVPTSDFYVEPFLRDKPPVNKPDSPIAKIPTPKVTPQKKTVTPQPKKTAPKTSIAAKKPPVPKKAPVKIQTVQTKPKADTVKRTNNIPV